MKTLKEICPLDFNGFIGREIGNVTLLKELGHGNRGVVFQGFQKSLKRRVAVKILPKANSTTEEDQLLFQDEAEILAALSHPNIIPIFEMGEEDDFYFQVMQLIVGSDLNTIIKKIIASTTIKEISASGRIG
jgi:serine/threonine-protein kinase